MLDFGRWYAWIPDQVVAKGISVVGQDAQSGTSHEKRPRKGGLGRGLSSLIPTTPNVTNPATDVPDSPLRTIGVGHITPNPYQPRTTIEREQLEELAASIRSHGLMQPVIVSEAATPGEYTLIAGERRWRASQLAGIKEIPAIVRNAAGQELLELAIIENVVRADLSPLEEAWAYKQLIDEFDLTQMQVADRVGRSRVSVTNTLRLLTAPDRVQEALAAGEITEGHARAILGSPNAIDQIAILDEVVKRGLSVRQTEQLVRGWRATNAEEATKSTSRDPEELRVEDKLRSALGTRVSLKRSSTKGGSTLTIQFFTEEQLQAFYDKIVGEDIW